MTNIEFKQRIVDLGVALNGVFCSYDVIINKSLEIFVRPRIKKDKPNLKVGEIVVIEAINSKKNFKQIAEHIAKSSVETTLAIYDVQEHEDKAQRIKELDEQIKYQIELIKFNLIADAIKEITPAEQKRLFYKLGIKNADKFVDGIDDSPIY